MLAYLLLLLKDKGDVRQQQIRSEEEIDMGFKIPIPHYPGSMRFDMVVPVHLDSVLNALIIAVVLIAGCMMIVGTVHWLKGLQAGRRTNRVTNLLAAAAKMHPALNR